MYDYRPAEPPASLTIILAALAATDAERLLGAFQFAAAAHAGQLRDEGTPYIEHPTSVARILWSELGCRDVDVLMAAITHDVLEDCPDLTQKVLAAATSERAASIVEHVTKPRVSADKKESRDLAYLERLRNLPQETRLVKLADRLHNLRSAPRTPDIAKAQRYLEVSRREFLPLALLTDPTAAELIAEACDDLERHLARSVPG